MRQLRLVGLAEDGGSLLLESPTGESYRLALDERVRAACRGDLTRLGQIEIETDNPLRPREIQARVRAGESAEQVATSSGMPLDRVLRFAYPVLQERSRVVAQARSTPVRPAADQLGGLVEERLVGRGTDAATLEWDAWRRDDGRWAVRLSWRQGERAHAANWSLDLGRRALQAEDPAAEQLSAKEFHARTITAVTPLAVAARTAPEAPAPAPPRRTRPATGASRGSAAAETAASPAERPRPGNGGSTRAGSERAGSERAGSERAGSERAGSERAGSERAGSERAGSERAGSERAGSERAGSERAGSERAGSERAGSERAGSERAGSERAGSERAGSERAGSERAGSERAGSERAGSERAGSERAGSERAGSERAGSERTARTGPGGGIGRPVAERPANGTAAGRGAAGRRASAERRAREAASDGDPDEDGEPAEEARIASGGGTIPLIDADGEDDRSRRATVPSWDDILLGVRRRH